MKRKRNLIQGAAALVAVAGIATGSANAAPVVYGDDSGSAAELTQTVDAFRAALGIKNNNGPCTAPCTPGVGHRDVNWDAVPAANSSPNAFPSDFFNQPTGAPAGRVRGIQFATPGTGFRVSADPPDAIEFDDINATYSSTFQVFSADQLFTPLGSTMTEVTFSLPGLPSSPAVTAGFGVVFTDVDSAESTSVSYFGVNDELLLKVFASPQDLGLSFVGALFDGAIVSRVLIDSGDVAVGPDDLGLSGDVVVDVVVMDDFIFGEPVQPVPLPNALALFASGLLGLIGWKRRRT